MSISWRVIDVHLPQTFCFSLISTVRCWHHGGNHFLPVFFHPCHQIHVSAGYKTPLAEERNFIALLARMCVLAMLGFSLCGWDLRLSPLHHHRLMLGWGLISHVDGWKQWKPHRLLLPYVSVVLNLTDGNCTLPRWNSLFKYLYQALTVNYSGNVNFPDAGKH